MLWGHAGQGSQECRVRKRGPRGEWWERGQVLRSCGPCEDLSTGLGEAWSRELGAEYCAGMKQVSPGEGLPVEGAGREGSSEEVTLELYLLQTISTFRQLDALLLQAKALRVLQHLNWASCSPCHPCPHRSPSRDHYFFF